MQALDTLADRIMHWRPEWPVRGREIRLPHEAFDQILVTEHPAREPFEIPTTHEAWRARSLPLCHLVDRRTEVMQTLAHPDCPSLWNFLALCDLNRVVIDLSVWLAAWRLA